MDGRKEKKKEEQLDQKLKDSYIEVWIKGYKNG